MFNGGLSTAFDTSSFPIEELPIEALPVEALPIEAFRSANIIMHAIYEIQLYALVNDCENLQLVSDSLSELLSFTGFSSLEFSSSDHANEADNGHSISLSE